MRVDKFTPQEITALESAGFDVDANEAELERNDIAIVIGKAGGKFNVLITLAGVLQFDCVGTVNQIKSGEA
jgi:hypothetical protein